MTDANDDVYLRTRAADLGEDLERIASQPHPLSPEQRARLYAILSVAGETFTVTGVWIGSDPVPLAVVRGQHAVDGGDWSRFPEGLWATSVDAVDVAAAQVAAVAEMRGGDDDE